MKLCLVSESFLPTIGGAEIVVHMLATEFHRMGIETTIITSSSNRLVGFSPAYRVEYFPHTPRRFMQLQVFTACLLALHKRERFDLIHFHKATLAYGAARLRWLLGVPLVITSHGGDIQTFPELGYGDRLDPACDRRTRYSVSKADLLTAIGSSTRQAYIDVGAPEQKIVNIQNGVNLTRFAERRGDIRERLGLTANTKILLTVGRCHAVKGHRHLLKAVAEVVKTHKEVKCLMIGKRLETLDQEIARLGIQDAVLLVEQQSFDSEDGKRLNPDSIPNDFLLSAYMSSDIYVSASLIEAFPLTLVEAMAAGLPIVATNVWGNEDIVVDAENGFLVPPKDLVAMSQTIVKLLDDQMLRERIGVRAKLMAEQQYDWMKIAQQYVIAYRRLVKE